MTKPPPRIDGRQCPNCGQPIVGWPTLCPSCGYRVGPKSARRLISAIAALVLCGGPSLFMGACLSSISAPNQVGLYMVGGVALLAVFLAYAIYELVVFLRKD